MIPECPHCQIKDGIKISHSIYKDIITLRYGCPHCYHQWEEKHNEEKYNLRKNIDGKR